MLGFEPNVKMLTEIGKKQGTRVPNFFSQVISRI